MPSTDLNIEASFPRLTSTNYRVTSPDDWLYNCIAYAAGDQSRFWWPALTFFPGSALAGSYWPDGIPIKRDVETFVLLFEGLGYVRCNDGDFVSGYEKVAIYATHAGLVKHAARQLPNGAWASKLGSGRDIEHDEVDGVSGGVGVAEYGEPSAFLQRPSQP